MAFNYVRKLKAADGLDYLFRDIEVNSYSN